MRLVSLLKTIPRIHMTGSQVWTVFFIYKGWFCARNGKGERAKQLEERCAMVNLAPKPRWFSYTVNHFPKGRKCISLADIALEQLAWQTAFSLAFKDILSVPFISCKCMNITFLSPWLLISPSKIFWIILTGHISLSTQFIKLVILYALKIKIVNQLHIFILMPTWNQCWRLQASHIGSN